MALIIDDFSVGVGSGSPADFSAAGWTWVGLEAGPSQAGYYKIVDGVRYKYTNQGAVPVSGTASTTSGGGGGGYGGGGGSSGGGVKNINGYIDAFEFWFGAGVAPMGAVQSAVDGMWTDAQIKQYAITHGANGYNAQTAREAVLDIARQTRGSDWSSTLSDPLIDSLAAGTYLNQDDYLANYFVDMPGFDVMSSPLTQSAIDLWVDQTGIALTWTAQQKLNRLVRDYGGLTTAAMTEWETWIPTTHSAKNGNYGADKRVQMKTFLEPLLGRTLTDAELSPDGSLWEKNEAALYEWVQTTPEYLTKFSAKPAGMSEANFLSQKAAWDVVYRQAYGIDVAELSGMPGTFGGGPQLTPEGQRKMQEFGFSSYDEWAKYAGGRGRFDQIAKDSGWMADGTFSTVPGAPSDFLAWGMKNSSPEEWMQHVQWEQQAIVAEGTYEGMMTRTMGLNLSQDDWYKYTSKAIGWGEIQLQIMEAQNRDRFREVFRDYTGHDPSVSDFDYLTNSFVSPSEYARRMGAKESAAEMFPAANELMNRVFGHGTSVAELENLAMGGQGSGALKAQLNQAARLDEYRLTHKLKYGTEPTPTDFARYAGYAGPAELEWELNLAEGIDEFGPDIQEVWKKVYNESISEEELRIMLGDMVGSGDLKYRYKQAKEEVTKLEQEHDAGFTTPTAMHMYTGAKEGGIKNVLPGIQDMASI